MKHVVIIGGGLIGLSTAYSLQQRGVEQVTILEEADGPHGASLVHAGWISPGHSDPVPAPGLVRQSMKWMMRSDSPLYIRPGAMADPDFARWMYRFWRACNSRNQLHAIASMSALNSKTFPLFEAYLANGINFEMHKVGLLSVFLNANNIDRELKHVALYEKFGIKTPTPLLGNDAREFEPSLSDQVGGVFLIETERHIRPETLTNALVQWVTDHNVDLRTRTKVTGLEIHGGKVCAVQTTAGKVEADAVVIAAGARSGEISRMAGVKLPIQGGKGYSIDYTDPPTTPLRPMSIYEARMAITPTSGYVRLAGTMELSGINTVVRQERVAALARGAGIYLHGWDGKVGDGKVGSGLRPMTPDGMPIIGPVPGVRNLSISSGHQMLGVTLSAASGDALAEEIVTGKPQEVLEPFRAERFTRAARRIPAFSRK
ncbi:MAG: FAD-dependent oxidoreductase [Chloroflexota bacterium]|nr:FAD-dependent oxidoreductase [Chloroflexota bacterium]